MEETLSTSPASNFVYIFFPIIAFLFALASFIGGDSTPNLVILILVGVSISLGGFISFRIRKKVIKESAEQQIIGTADVDEELEQPRQDHGEAVITSTQVYNIVKPLMRFSLPVVRVFLPSLLILYDNLLIRMFSKENGSSAWMLNFGPVRSEDGIIAPSNIALDKFDGPTFGIVFQGVLAGLLIFPAINGCLAKFATKVKTTSCLKRFFNQESDDLPLLLLKPCVFTLNFLQLLQSFLTYFPMICTINLWNESGVYFCQGALQSNILEYTLGGLMGVAFGAFISALIHRKLMNMADTPENRIIVIAALTIGIAESQDPEVDGVKSRKLYAFGKASDYNVIAKPSYIVKAAQMISFANLILFSVTVIMISYLYGATWLPVGEKFCFPMIACNLGNYAFLMLCFFCFTRSWTRG